MLSYDFAFDECQRVLKKLKTEVFTDDVELTLVMRHPQVDSCWAVVSRDKPEKVIAVLEQTK